MRKIILFTLFISSISAAYCQEFTLKIGGGYGWPGLTNNASIDGFQPLLSNNINQVVQVLDPANATILPLANTTAYGNFKSGSYQDTAGSKSVVHGSYGKGWNFGIELGYKVNAYLSIGLGFNYLFGSTISATQLFGNSLAQTLGDNTTVTTSTYAYGLSLIPNVTIYAAKRYWRLKPYVRAGLNLPMAGSVIDNIHINSPGALAGSQLLTSDLRVVTAAQFSIGYTGGLGLSYSPIPLISVWGEVNATSINVAAKSSTLTEYVINSTGLASSSNPGQTTTANRITGTGLLPQLIYYAPGGATANAPLTEYSKVIDYVDQINANSNSTDYGKARATTAQSGTPGYVNENQAHQEQRIFAPFSNFGIAIGITISMSKKIFKDPLGKKKKEEGKS